MDNIKRFILDNFTGEVHFRKVVVESVHLSSLLYIYTIYNRKMVKSEMLSFQQWSNERENEM